MSRGPCPPHHGSGGIYPPSPTDDGVSFVYTEQKQKGAVYNVYAASDIVSADGTVVYKKDALVKAGLTTGDDGSATLDNLYLGKYVVKECRHHKIWYAQAKARRSPFPMLEAT